MSSEEWKKVNLGNFACIKTGKLNSNAAEIEGIYPFFTCSPETYRINSFAFDCEAAILAGNNANGIFCLKYYKGKFNAYQRTYIITTDPEKADIKFVYFQLDLRLSRLKNISHGTATKYLTLPLLNEIEVNLPSVKTQQRIVEILSALDDKIELNRQTNATLEAIAQAIFKEWFVDFNYPDATGEMAESQLGMIPKGWRVGNLGEEGEFKNGINYSRDEGGDAEYSIANVRNIVANKFVVSANLDKINANVNKATPYLLERQDILIARSASPGNASLVYETYENVIFSGFTIRYRLPKKEYTMFLFLLLQTIREKLEDLANGTTLKSINQASLRAVQIVIPDVKIILDFNAVIIPLYDQIVQNQTEEAVLSQIREQLLPELMSGRLELR